MNKNILNEVKRNRELMGLNEQGITTAIDKGVEAGKKMSTKTFVMRKGEDGKMNWVEGDAGENEHTTKKVFDDYVIYSRTDVPSYQRNQVQQFVMNVAKTYDNLTELLSNEEVAKILNKEYQEGRPLNPQVTQSENGLYNYSYYFKK